MENESCMTCNNCDSARLWCSKKSKYIRYNYRCKDYVVGDWIRLRHEKGIKLKEDFDKEYGK